MNKRENKYSNKIKTVEELKKLLVKFREKKLYFATEILMLFILGMLDI